MEKTSEELLIEQIFDNIDLRFDTLKKFYPFFKISLSRYKPESYPNLCNIDLGYVMLALFEFFVSEGTLKNKGLRYGEIKNFLSKIIFQSYGIKLSLDELNRLMGDLFDRLRNDGSTYFEYTCYNPKKKDNSFKKVSYLKSEINQFDDKNYYYLTSDALEFFLRTKEFSDENKISIELILLKKLIQSNNFSAALDSVIRVNSYVSTHIAKKREILQQLVSNGREGFESYKKYNQTTIKCLGDEKDLFKETSDFVKTTLQEYSDKIEKEQLKEKEKKAFETLKRIEIELKITLEKHMTLLREVSELIVCADEILSSNQAALFTEYFKFDLQQQKAIDKDDVRLLKLIMEPLFMPRVPKSFNVNAIDKMYSMKKPMLEDHGLEEEKEDIEIISENQIVKERVSHNFFVFAEELLLTIQEKTVFDLEEFLMVLRNKYGESSVLNPDLFSFILGLSRHKGEFDYKEYKFDMSIPNSKLKGLDSLFQNVILKNSKLSGLRDLGFRVSTLNNHIEFNDVYKVTNIKFERIREESV